MLLTFKSKAAADILMYQDHAQPILDLLHKDSQRGIITAAESGAAIAALEAAIAAAPAGKDDDDSGDGSPKPVSVSLAARMHQLLEMLRAAHRGGHDVVWGV
jgi:hypothetical protein